LAGHDRPPSGAAGDVPTARERTAHAATERAHRPDDEFLLTLSEELRGPLNAIMSWVYLLRSGKLDAPNALHALETIERNVEAERRLIGDMLEPERTPAVRIRLHLSPAELAPVVAETMRSGRTRRVRTAR
jgi:signal transduction histidine kinase